MYDDHCLCVKGERKTEPNNSSKTQLLKNQKNQPKYSSRCMYMYGKYTQDFFYQLYYCVRLYYTNVRSVLWAVFNFKTTDAKASVELLRSVSLSCVESYVNAVSSVCVCCLDHLCLILYGQGKLEQDFFSVCVRHAFRFCPLG